MLVHGRAVPQAPVHVDEICGLFKLAGMLEDVVKKKVFPLYLKGKALAWYRLCDDIGSCTGIN